MSARKIFPIKRLHFFSKHNDPKEFDMALKFDMSSAMANLSIKKKMTQKLGSIGSALKPKSVGIPELFYYEPSYRYAKKFVHVSNFVKQ